MSHKIEHPGVHLAAEMKLMGVTCSELTKAIKQKPYYVRYIIEEKSLYSSKYAREIGRYFLSLGSKKNGVFWILQAQKWIKAHKRMGFCLDYGGVCELILDEFEKQGKKSVDVCSLFRSMGWSGTPYAFDAEKFKTDNPGFEVVYGVNGRIVITRKGNARMSSNVKDGSKMTSEELERRVAQLPPFKKRPAAEQSSFSAANEKIYTQAKLLDSLSFSEAGSLLRPLANAFISLSDGQAESDAQLEMYKARCESLEKSQKDVMSQVDEWSIRAPKAEESLKGLEAIRKLFSPDMFEIEKRISEVHSWCKAIQERLDNIDREFADLKHCFERQVMDEERRQDFYNSCMAQVDLMRARVERFSSWAEVQIPAIESRVEALEEVHTRPSAEYEAEPVVPDEEKRRGDEVYEAACAAARKESQIVETKPSRSIMKSNWLAGIRPRG